MPTVTINGVTITAGRSIKIANNRVIIDGEDVTPDAKQITIQVNGNVERLNVDVCEVVTIAGDAVSVQTTSGDINVGGNVGGSVSSVSGDIDCGSIAGDVSTVSGDIKQRRA